MAEPDGTHIKRLTNGSHDLLPVWSPDGKQIAFNRMISDRFEIFVMNADGSQQRSLTSKLIGDAWHPSWSPDGKHIGFFHDKDVFLIAPDGTNIRRLTTTGVSGPTFSWSPDSQYIVYRWGPEIFVIGIDSNDFLSLGSYSVSHDAPMWRP